MKILVCEDDVMLSKGIEFRLKKEGYEITCVENGKEAMEILEDNEFNLIITDMLMPYSNGLELIDFVRTKQKMDTPIIVLSRVGDSTTVVEAFKMGANDYVTKPFSPEELILRSKRLIS